MADPEGQRPKKVSQSAIDEIKKLGMGAAIKKYSSGEGSPEFKAAVERYYSSSHLKKGSASVPKASASSELKTVPMPPSAPAAATRAISNPKGMAHALGAPMKESGPKKPKSNAFVAATKAGKGKGVSFPIGTKKTGKSSMKERLERDYQYQRGK